MKGAKIKITITGLTSTKRITSVHGRFVLCFFELAAINDTNLPDHDVIKFVEANVGLLKNPVLHI